MSLKATIVRYMPTFRTIIQLWLKSCNQISSHLAPNETPNTAILEYFDNVDTNSG